MKKNRNFNLSIALLQELSQSALRNSKELCLEASLLERNGHYARAYFLAVASIEETGKAKIAFDAQGRKFNDSAVCDRIKRSLEDHSSKITSAFIPWVESSPDMRKTLIKVTKWMAQLKFARELSMYTDFNIEKLAIYVPSEIVPAIAAKDCVRLANDCLVRARNKLDGREAPTKSTPMQDALFALKPKIYNEIMKMEDFHLF